MADFETIGFIGLGVMGEPMCQHLAAKLDARVIAYDINPEPLKRLAKHGVAAAGSIAEIAGSVDLVLISVPGSEQLEQVCIGDAGIIASGRPGLLVADLSTCSVGPTRKVAAALIAKGIDFVDAPVTRTAQAALDGTLSIMMGGDKAHYDRLEPVLLTMGSDVSHAGAIGTGQVSKILNNMVCFQTIVALSEALTMARRIGMDEGVLYDILCKGSADSFALRNHGSKCMWPGTFVKNTFSTMYALKDIGYALELAEDTDVNARGAELAHAVKHAVSARGKLPPVPEERVYDGPPEIAQRLGM